MNFAFNEDQLLIAQSADSFLTAVSTSEAVRGAMASELGFDPKVWGQIIEQMGWQLTHIPEQNDGLGLGVVELCILFEKMGYNLFCSPFFSSVALAVNALRVCSELDGNSLKASELLSALASGESQVAVAFSDSGRRWGLASIGPEFSNTGPATTISGNAHYVLDAGSANQLIVVAKSADGEGVGFFAIDPKQEGVTISSTPAMDQTRKLFRIEFSQVSVSIENQLLVGVQSEEAFEDFYALANIAQAAEQLGVADRCLLMTVDYISERKQFGRVVGGFQAMKHKAADMMNKVEASRSSVYFSACVADEYFSALAHGESQKLNAARNDLREAASIANAYCCDAAFFNAGSAMQMHGGVGFTWEYDVHLYFKRAKAAQNSLGDSAWHKANIATKLLGAIK